MSYYDRPPEDVFGVCINCKDSEEDHTHVEIAASDYFVCPDVCELAEAIAADYDLDDVYDSDDNTLVIAYENAMEDVEQNEYTEADEYDYI